jgi:lysine 2,3-aminomutase
LRTIRSVDDLVAAGLAAPDAAPALEAVADRYSLAITPDMAALIDPNDPNDPVARQFVPDARELLASPDELPDPIGDGAHSPVEGIVHRYPDRVLLKLLHVCPVYCRFCFRREVVGPGGEQSLSPSALDTAMAYIAARPEIWEVILTGGDPLALSPRRLADVFRRLGHIEHVKIVRIHTRVPAVDPARITGELTDVLRGCGKTVYVALHANHPRELTPQARAACARLIDAGIPMVSQTVLLKGVNDSVDTLAALMRAFVEARIKPYYLHHADMARGTSHLRTSLKAGKELVRALRGHVSGLCQPAYVLDIPGGHGKAPVGPDLSAADDSGGWRITDFRGVRHDYSETPDGGEPPRGSMV